MIVEDLQEIKDPLEGRKYLEKHSLLCPPGEPPTHISLATCLHQISGLAGVQKPVINAIRAVAFLLEELEDTHINEVVRDALNVQMDEFTSDMKEMIEHAKSKIDEHIKESVERLKTSVQPQPQAPAQYSQATSTYASVLVSPPAHANPRIAAREGIKARQFMIEGIKNSKFSHLDTLQLKTELSKILTNTGLISGKIRSITNVRNGAIIVEMDSDNATKWISNKTTQDKICEDIGANAQFVARAFNVIAFNVPLALDAYQVEHREEICEANDLDKKAITAIRWAKAVENRTENQRTGHLILTFNNADAANRAITNGLTICNRRCHVEKVKREPTRCLKCQGWNHFAKDCNEEKNTCGSCAGEHRSSSCLVNERRCVSCKTDDHASWSRSCPTFLRKTEEYNTRNPENSLQFFPTTDPWTWTSSERLSTGFAVNTPLPPPPKPRPTPNNSQIGKKPQHNRRQMDTYIPTDSYIPDYGRHDEPPCKTGPGWDTAMPGPSKTTQAPLPSQRSQGSTHPNDEDSFNRPPPSSQSTNA